MSDPESSSNQEPSTVTADQCEAIASDRLTRGQMVFIAFLALSGMAILGISAYRFLRPPTLAPRLREEAEKYLRFRKSSPLSEPLAQLFADPELFVVESQPHPLLGQPAPEFRLVDHQKNPLWLSSMVERGPVVVIFYYGYYCDHCVAQLFGINEDMERFRELGASVVAISADAPELTAQRFEQYGAFGFPVLSDPDQTVTQSYGCYRPGSAKTAEDALHGTFLIGRDGLIHWVDRGHEPFLHNRTLLYELARMEGKLQDRSTQSAPRVLPNPIPD